jgi:hypothetical protein
LSIKIRRKLSAQILVMGKDMILNFLKRARCVGQRRLVGSQIEDIQGSRRFKVM